MKKIIAIILAAVMVLGLCACAGDKDTPSKTPEASKAPAESAAPAESSAPAESDGGGATAEHDLTAAGHFGFFNADYDYSKDEPVKIALISYSWDNMLQTIANNCSSWAEKMGVEFTSTDSDSNAETLISNIEMFASQGYDGLIINAFSTYMDTVIDLCKELNVNWWSLSEVAYRSTGELTQPYVVTDDTTWGYDVLSAEIKWMQENVPGFNAKECMILGISLTTLSVFVNRHTGFENAWKELLPEARFEICDGLSEGGINAETGYAIASTRATANKDIKYWIYADVMGYYAPGCLTYVEENKLTDTSIISSCGAENLIPLFVNGTNGAWRFALHGDYSIGFAAAFHALYAVCAGWCSYEDMWPDTKAAGETYGHINSGYVKLTPENYQDYLEFSDQFGHLNNYDYEWSGKVYTVIQGDGGATE